jgi:hypothetical protein
LKRVNDEKKEADIRQSREILNKSTKTKRANKKKAPAKKKTAPKTSEEEDMSSSLSSEDETTKNTTSKNTESDKTASKKATPKEKTNKKKAPAKKKTAPKTSEEEDMSSSLSSKDKTTEKTTSKKTASEKTASKKTTPKKKTASKPAGVIDTTSLPSEDDHEDLEGVTIRKHSYDKKEGLYTVWVSWKKSKKVEWQFLHDMWVDYPEEVKKYRDRHRLTASAWQVPNIDDAAFVVRILSMNGPTPLSATFCILFDNGYVEKKACLANVKSDAPELLTAFLNEREKETSS